MSPPGSRRLGLELAGRGVGASVVVLTMGSLLLGGVCRVFLGSLFFLEVEPLQI